MAANTEAQETADVDLGDLLDAGDGAIVTLVVDETQLAAHTAVLANRSPVFAAMFAHDTLEASSRVVSILDVEDTVLRQLLSYCYTLRVPQLPDTAPQLLAAADKYGLSALRNMCEQQVAAQLDTETAAAAAVLAVRHSCPRLRAAAIAHIRAHHLEVMATKGWADAMLAQPQDLVEVSRLLSEPPAEPRVNHTAANTEAQEMADVDLSDHLDAGDSAMVTLMAGETQLVAHRAVLAARSPVLAAMLEASSGVVSIPDMEGAVLRQLLSYCYTLWARQLPSVASQLLAAADKYGLSALKDACERQVAAQLDTETAAAAAVLAVSHSCPGLRAAAIAHIRAHHLEVMATKGWADAMLAQPLVLIEVSRLLSEPPAEPSAPAATETGTAATSLPQSEAPAAAAQPTAAQTTPPPDSDTVSRLRRLSKWMVEEKLMEAAKKGAVGELRALLAAGADVTVRDGFCGWTALHWAADRGHVGAVRCLLDAGAHVNAMHRFLDETPLHGAAWNGHADVVRLLVASSVELNNRGRWGMTALHWAAYHGHAEVAAVLLEAGADKSIRDNFGKTPFSYCASSKNQRLVDLLR